MSPSSLTSTLTIAPALQVDVALITHFHLDHCAAVPYLLQKTKFKGRTLMTHPTKAIYHSLLRDFARQGKVRQGGEAGGGGGEDPQTL